MSFALGALTRDRPVVIDVAVALFLLCYSALEIISGASDRAAVPLYLAGTVVMAAPLALRRTHPWLPAVAFLPATLLDSVWVEPVNAFGQFVIAMLAAYSLAARATVREAVLGGVTFSIAVSLFLYRDPMTTSLAGAMATVVPLLVCAGIGLVVRHRRDDAEVQAREAVGAERTRIARELHDLVGHAVSLMTVQAGVARVALDNSDGRQASLALAAIEGTGREALDELRRVLGILRMPDDEPTTFGPQPDLQAIEGLVDQHRQAGLPVALRLEGAPRPVSPGVALTVYRIVQEALTNVRKHAGAPTTEVCLRYAPEAVDVTVQDAGPGPSGRERGRHGLAGMRERVALYEGRFDAHPGQDGGFVVTATIPAGEGRT